MKLPYKKYCGNINRKYKKRKKVGFIKPKTDIESLVELAYILSTDEQTIKEIQEKTLEVENNHEEKNK